MAGIVDIAAQTAQGQRALISWFRPGNGRDGGPRRHRRGSWRRRGSAGDGRRRYGAGPPELERDDCRGCGDESGRDEEGQAVPGDQGAVCGAGARVGDGGECHESGGRAYLLGGDEQAARDALLAGRDARGDGDGDGRERDAQAERGQQDAGFSSVSSLGSAFPVSPAAAVALRERG
jgi:hypothetical protein